MANLFNTRIRLRYDTYTAWRDTNPILLEGEVAIAVPGTEFGNEGQKTSTASCLMKVGNGTAHFNDLPWLSALGADVHTWAKKSESEFKAWLTSADGPALATASEVAAVAGKVTTLEGKVKTLEETTIPGLDGRVEVLEGEMDTAQGNITSITGRLDTLEAATGANGFAKDIQDLKDADEAFESRIAANETAITTINGEGAGSIKKAVADEAAARDTAIGNAIATEVINRNTAIGEAIAQEVIDRNAAIATETSNRESAISAVNTELGKVKTTAEAADTLSKANSGILTTLLGEDSDKSIRTIATEEVAKIVDGAPEAFDTLKEVSNWIADDKSGAAAMSAAITANTSNIESNASAITALQAKDGEIDDAIEALDNKYAGQIGTVTEGKTLMELINANAQAIIDGDAQALADAKSYTNTELGKINSVNAGLEGRIKANEDKLTGLTTATVKGDIDAAIATAAGDATSKANAAQAAAEATAAADATSKANKAKEDAIADANAKFESVNSNITSLQNFDKTAITGHVTPSTVEGQPDSIAFKLDGTALELIFVCGGASI